MEILIAHSFHEIGIPTECRQVVGAGSHSCYLYCTNHGFLPCLRRCFQELRIQEDACKLCNCYGCKDLIQISRILLTVPGLRKLQLAPNLPRHFACTNLERITLGQDTRRQRRRSCSTRYSLLVDFPTIRTTSSMELGISCFVGTTIKL